MSSLTGQGRDISVWQCLGLHFLHTFPNTCYCLSFIFSYSGELWSCTSCALNLHLSKSRRLTPMISFKNFIFLAFIFRSLINSKLIFEHLLMESDFILLPVAVVQLSQQHFLKRLVFFPIEFSWNPPQKPIGYRMSVFLDSEFLCSDYMPTLMPVLPQSLDYCSPVISFVNGKCEFSSFVLFKDILFSAFLALAYGF